LAAALSLELAMKTKIWDRSGDLQGSGDLQAYKTKLSSLELDPERVNHWQSRFKNDLITYHSCLNKKNTFIVTYEDLYESNKDSSYDIIERMFKFVGYEIDNKDQILELLDIKNKLNTKEMYSLLANYDQIVNQCANRKLLKSFNNKSKIF
jgi:hypothetical protein